jgi:hypothetical protein
VPERHSESSGLFFSAPSQKVEKPQFRGGETLTIEMDSNVFLHTILNCTSEGAKQQSMFDAFFNRAMYTRPLNRALAVSGIVDHLEDNYERNAKE